METKRKTEPGAIAADGRYKITIAPNGPYLVYGTPPLKQLFIARSDNNKQQYVEGKEFAMQQSPTALCRCGGSHKKPYCDGTHTKIEWNSNVVASTAPIQEQASVRSGKEIDVSDNPKYCIHARFCIENGNLFKTIEESNSKEQQEAIVQMTDLCPSDRLKAWSKTDKTPIETLHPVGIMLIEDELLHVSGPLWVRGGIFMDGPNGEQYELRNKMTLCRCGHSSNMPYCDGTHIKIGFHDKLPSSPIEDTEA